MLVAGLFARDQVIADVSTAPCDLHCKLQTLGSVTLGVARS